MKKVFAIIAIAGLLSACNNKAKKKMDEVKDSAASAVESVKDSANKMIDAAKDTLLK